MLIVLEVQMIEFRDTCYVKPPNCKTITLHTLPDLQQRKLNALCNKSLEIVYESVTLI